MVVLGLMLIIAGITLIATPVGWLLIAVGAFALTWGPGSAKTMKEGGLEDGCMGNAALLFAIVMVFFLLAMSMTDGQVAVDATNTLDRNVYQPLHDYNQRNGNERPFGW